MQIIIGSGSGGAGAAGAGSLAAVFGVCPTTNVNLSTQGIYDWFAINSSTSTPINMASGHFKRLGGWIAKTFVWAAEGTSLASQVFSGTGFSVSTTIPDDIFVITPMTNSVAATIAFTGSGTLINYGFRFEVPADTNQRVLRVYGELFSNDMIATCRLSDGSAADVSVTKTCGAGAGAQYMLQVTYKSAQPCSLLVSCMSSVNHGSSPNIKFSSATLAAV